MSPPSASRSRGTVIVLAIGLVVIAIDQVTKYWAVNELSGQPPVEVIGQWLRLTFVRNPGGAFSIGTEFTWLFTTVALGVAIAILVYARKVTSPWWLLALGVLFGGALGNLIDRMAQPPGPGRGHVVDFLQLPYWPVFNVADMAVVGSTILIVALSLFGVDPSPTPGESAVEEPSQPTGIPGE